MLAHIETKTDDTKQIWVADSLAAVETLRNDWQRLQTRAGLHADIDRYLARTAGRPETVQPYVVVTGEIGAVQSLLIGYIEQRPLHWPLLGQRGQRQCLVVEHGGILGDDITPLLNHAGQALDEGTADIAELRDLPADGAVHQACRQLTNRRVQTSEPTPHRSMTMPKNVQAFLAARSKKHRGNLRRAVRTLENEFGTTVEIRRYNDQDWPKGLTAAAEITAQTYQAALGGGLPNSETNRRLLATAAEKGWLQLTVMWLQEKPAAYQLGLIYNDCYYLETIGYDPKYTDYSLGSVLFLKELEHLCPIDNIITMDLGFGDADYKRSYATDCQMEVSVTLVARRLKPRAIEWLRRIKS